MVGSSLANKGDLYYLYPLKQTITLKNKQFFPVSYWMIHCLATGMSSWFLKSPGKNVFVLCGWEIRKWAGRAASLWRFLVPLRSMEEYFETYISKSFCGTSEMILSRFWSKKVISRESIFYITVVGCPRWSPRTTRTNHVPFDCL